MTFTASLLLSLQLWAALLVCIEGSLIVWEYWKRRRRNMTERFAQQGYFRTFMQEWAEKQGTK